MTTRAAPPVPTHPLVDPSTLSRPSYREDTP